MILSKDKENLLKKLINFDTIWEYDSIPLKHAIYELFFDWSSQFTQKYQGRFTKDRAASWRRNLDPEDIKHTEESQTAKQEEVVETKDDKKKKQKLNLDQEMFEFDERGGFP